MEEINGFYDDDGNKINPNSIPKPQLCLSCKFNADPREELLCTLTRLDQKDEPEFTCFSYEAAF